LLRRGKREEFKERVTISNKEPYRMQIIERTAAERARARAVVGSLFNASDVKERLNRALDYTIIGRALIRGHS